MVKFKFSKPNGIAEVGKEVYITEQQAQIFERIMLGDRVLDSKPKETKTRVKKEK